MRKKAPKIVRRSTMLHSLKLAGFETRRQATLHAKLLKNLWPTLDVAVTSRPTVKRKRAGKTITIA